MTTCGPATLDEIAAGIKLRLETIAGLRALATEPDQPNFPAAYPRLVEGANSDFDGDIEYLFDVWVITGLEPGFNRAQTVISPFLSPTGRKSMRAAIEADPTLGGTVSSAWVEGIGAPGRLDMAGLTVFGANLRLRVFA